MFPAVFLATSTHIPNDICSSVRTSSIETRVFDTLLCVTVWLCAIFILSAFNSYCLAGESGSADTVRDPRGFAMKFYTEDGNWDLVGNNTPIFFIRDAMLVCEGVMATRGHQKESTNSPYV